MTIELNLVFSQGIYSTIYSLLSRARTQVESSEDTMAAVLKFLTDNSQILRETLSNGDIVNRIEGADFLSVSEFMSLKYLLSSQGVDVLVNEVAEMEVNPESIPEGQMEYMIVDDLNITNSVKLASKFIMDIKDANLAEVFNKVIEVGNYFSTDLTKGFKNPLTTAMTTLDQTEKYLGQSPVGITSSIEDMLKYLGKSIFVITNQQ